MRVAVVGGGAWGLPAAAELAARGHDVRLLDQYGPANRFASSAGATRLWRLSHPDRVRVRLARRAVEAWARLSAGFGGELLERRGLLWRDDDPGQVAAALAAEDVPYVAVDAPDVGRWFPGLRPDGRDAVWQADAGPVLAETALAVQRQRFEAAGGAVVRARVASIDGRGAGLRLGTAGGDRYDADVAVVAPGPWAAELLPALGVRLPLAPVLEQVAYLVGRDGWPDLPCLYDGEHGERTGAYAMPTPGIGYKIGIDRPLRAFDPADEDRTPDPAISAAIARLARDDLGWPTAEVVAAQVCSWTHSPDGRFVIGRLPDRPVVVACGDCGEGFKFSALLGELLADLAEGRLPDVDVATFGLDRFGSDLADLPARPTLGH